MVHTLIGEQFDFGDKQGHNFMLGRKLTVTSRLGWKNEPH